MNTTNSYLDAIAKKYARDGRPLSDNQVGRLLNIERQTVSSYRRGITRFDPDRVAPLVAKLLDIPLEQVLIDTHMERTKSPETRAAWQRISRLLARAQKKGARAAAIALVIVFSSISVGTYAPTANAADPIAAESNAQEMSIMLNALRRLARWLARLLRRLGGAGAPQAVAA